MAHRMFSIPLHLSVQTSGVHFGRKKKKQVQRAEEGADGESLALATTLSHFKPDEGDDIAVATNDPNEVRKYFHVTAHKPHIKACPYRYHHTAQFRAELSLPGGSVHPKC